MRIRHEASKEALQHNLKELRAVGRTESQARAFAPWVARRGRSRSHQSSDAGRRRLWLRG